MESDEEFARRIQNEFDRENLIREGSFLSVPYSQGGESSCSSGNPTQPSPGGLQTKTLSSGAEKILSNPQVSLIDPSLEYKDPTPDVHSLFVTFNKSFFWNKLDAVEVLWSPRMTLCAGVCRYRTANRACTIHLSVPLLKLRPRKDLVETLLHEMIHAYLFVTHNNRDRDGHGPEFQSHMKRINRIAGTNITIYHSFHDEVEQYRKHIWKCTGQCQYEKPFFGIVRRAMNRAPGPNDFWFADHQRRCGGTFMKIAEPDSYKQKTAKKNRKENPSMKKIDNYFRTAGASNEVATSSGDKSKAGEFKTTPSSSVEDESLDDPKTVSPDEVEQETIVSFPGIGVSLSTTLPPPLYEKPWLKRLDDIEKKSNLSNSSPGPKPSLKRLASNSINKLGNVRNTAEAARSGEEPKKPKNKDVMKCVCPICQIAVDENLINQHLDLCLINTDEVRTYKECSICESVLDVPSRDPSICSECKLIINQDSDDVDVICDNRIVTCLACNKSVTQGDLERHLEACIVELD